MSTSSPSGSSPGRTSSRGRGSTDSSGSARCSTPFTRRGIAVDLATPTASPPPWLGHLHPETLPVTADGIQWTYGSRNQFTASSPIFREHVRAITRVLVEAFADHPAIVMWHVGNELGQIDYSDAAARSFRRWLEARYRTIDALNEAWATTVWSQGYGSFDEVLPPRAAPYHRNPAHELDFRRFSSDEMLSLFLEQRDIIRDGDPSRPVTTNFMGFSFLSDYRSWAPDIDVIADDAYPDPGDADSLVHAALVQDLMRSLGGGAPWLLMESSTSAVSWRDHNITKSPARNRLESLQAVARGADGDLLLPVACGALRSRALPLGDASPRRRRHRRAPRRARARRRPRAARGRSPAGASRPGWRWSGTGRRGGPRHPSPFRRHGSTRSTSSAAGTARSGKPMSPSTSWPRTPISSPYRAVIVPSLYLVDEERAAAFSRYTAAGGVLAVGPFSAVADPTSTLHVGRFPVPLTGLLGVSGEEWVPLPDEGVPATWTGSSAADGDPFVVHTYAEQTRSDGAEPIITLAAGPGAHQLQDAVAVARNAVGEGTAWYIGAVLPPEQLATVLAAVLEDAGVEPTFSEASPQLEVVRRGRHLFVLNHSDSDIAVPGHTLARALGLAPGTLLRDLLSSASIPTTADAAAHTLAAQDVRVLEEAP